jgi:phytol kinase
VSNDVLWLILSYVAVFALLAVGTWAGKAGRSPEITRKIIHIGVGTWIIPTTLFFDSAWMAIIPPASFVILNLISYRYRLVKAMEVGDRSPGTIYFPLAFVVLILVFWPGGLFVRGIMTQGAPELVPAIDLNPAPLVDGLPMRRIDFLARMPALAGILVLAWADAAAAILGRKYGRHRYTIGKATRSLEGSAAFLAFGVLALVMSSLLDGVVEARPLGSTLLDSLASTPRFLALLVPAALAEAASPAGLDNLVVPAVVAATMAAPYWM